MVLMGLPGSCDDPRDTRYFYGQFQHHSFFHKNEKSILDAWYSLVTINPVRTNATTILVDERGFAQLIQQSPDPSLIERYVSDSDFEPLTQPTFTSSSIKHHLRTNEIQTLDNIGHPFSLTTTRWRLYWKKFKFLYSGEMEELHLVRLGHSRYLGIKHSNLPLRQYPKSINHTVYYALTKRSFTYDYLLPFGLCDTAHVFGSYMTALLEPDADFCRVYLDDVIFSPDEAP